MALVTPDEGETVLLGWMLKDGTPSDTTELWLYNNNYTPDSDSTFSSFTSAQFTGAVSKMITRTTWSAVYLNGTAAEVSYPTQSWTCGGTGDTVHGYYVIDNPTDTNVLWAEKFGTARTLADGDILNLTPKFNLDSADTP